MKRPLVQVAMVYGAGLLLAEFFHPALSLLFSLSIGLAFLAIVMARLRSWFLWPMVLLAGWTNLSWRTAIVSSWDLRQTQGTAPAIVTVRGTLVETPSQRVFIRDEQERMRSLAQVRVEFLREKTNGHPAVGLVIITTPGLLPPEYFAGQQVEIEGVLLPPAGPLAEGLFDYRSYLRRQGIYYQLKTSSTNDWRLIPPLVSRPWGDRFLGWAQRTLAHGLPDEDESLRLLWAMTLGWRTALTNEVNEPFMRSGTMHIFAISGLHIVLIAGIFVALLRALQVSRGWCGAVVIPLIWFYTAATGWQSSAIRSTVMMTIVIAGWSLKRPSNLLNSLAVAAFIILLWDPQQLFQASFQLSFFVVLSIALLMPPFEKVRDHILRPNPLLPPHLVPWWTRFFKVCMRWVLTSFATSLAAWLGALPLTAYYFHLFSPITLLANLVVVPMSSCALASNMGSLICGGWLPWGTELFNYSAWLWMTWMVKASELATRVPGAFMYVRSPTFAEFLLFYSVLIGALAGWFARPRIRVWLIGSLNLLALVCGWQWVRSAGVSEITVLPVNGATAIFADLPGHENKVLIDCGSADSVQFITKPFLRAQGINRLENLVLTHGEARNVSGAEELVQLFSVRHVFASPVRARSPAYRTAIESFAEQKKLQTLCSGEQLGPWSVLHPAADDKFTRGDDNALVLLGKVGGVRVLLLSDVGRSGQNALLERNHELRADIVVTGIPSSGEPVSDALLDAIHPSVLIVTDAEFPVAKRANPALCERLGKVNIPVIYTRAAGAATIRVSAGQWQITTMTGGRFEGRAK